MKLAMQGLGCEAPKWHIPQKSGSAGFAWQGFAMRSLRCEAPNCYVAHGSGSAGLASRDFAMRSLRCEACSAASSTGTVYGVMAPRTSQCEARDARLASPSLQTSRVPPLWPCRLRKQGSHCEACGAKPATRCQTYDAERNDEREVQSVES